MTTAISSLAASSGLVSGTAATAALPPRTGNSTGTAAAGSGKDVFGMGTDGFMKLLLAQLQHQDPLKPMDDSAMVGQLASLTQIQVMNSMKDSLSGLGLSSAAAMVGKQVTGLDVNGNPASGIVSGIAKAGDTYVLKVGTQAVPTKTIFSLSDPSLTTTP